MAFPVEASASETVEAADTTTAHTLTYPASIAAGDRLIALMGINDACTVSGMPAGWSRIGGSASAPQCDVWEKIATGSESGSFDYTTSVSTKSGNLMKRVTGAHASTASEVASAAGNDANPNPPTLNPGAWDVEDTLWITFYTKIGLITVVPTAWPTNYGLYQNDYVTSGSPTTSNVGGGTACRELAAASDDPGTYTTASGSNNNWTAVTVAVRPAGAAAAARPKQNIRLQSRNRASSR